MRTYDFNVMLRAKYHFQISTLEGNLDNGISFGVSIINKFTRTNRPDRPSSRNRTEYKFPLLEILLNNL